MSLVKFIIILIFLALKTTRMQCKETLCVINGGMSLNLVDERFLSYSLDANFLIDFNASETSHQLAYPSFIKLATDQHQLTPITWKLFNVWAESANLTPIFSINGSWSPQAILPFLDAKDNSNFSCYWHLGYDCQHESIFQYKERLLTLRHVLDMYTSSKQKVVRSACSGNGNGNSDLAKKMLNELDDADAIMWELETPQDRSFPHLSKSSVPIWLIAPKPTHPMEFSSVLLWAKQIGEAARQGYEAIFLQTNLSELLADTPIRWISLLHKTLMGRTVLNVRTNSLPESDVGIYAHCAKKQPPYLKQGALVIFVVNNDTNQHTASLRLASSKPTNIDVHSYVLTSDDEQSRNLYLNGDRLLPDDFIRNDRLLFIPKIRKVRASKFLSLTVPEKSVGFFVIPDARLPACISLEDEIDSLMKELQYDQNTESIAQYSEELEDLKPVVPDYLHKNQADNHLSQELPDTIYKNHKPIVRKKDSGPNKKFRSAQTTKEFRQYLASRSATPTDKPAKLEIVFAERPMTKLAASDLNRTQIVELELSSAELKKILLGRAKSAAAEENIDVTSRELENLMMKATKNLVNDTETTPKRKSKSSRRSKRDINMELLKRNENKLKKQQQIEATLRKPEETSEKSLKYFDKSLEEDKQQKPDVYAELASSKEEDLIHQGDLPSGAPCGQAKYLDARIEFLKGPSEASSGVVDDLRNYHSFHETFNHGRTTNSNLRTNNNQVQEVDLNSQGDHKTNPILVSLSQDLPSSRPDKAIVEQAIRRLENYLNNPGDIRAKVDSDHPIFSLPDDQYHSATNHNGQRYKRKVPSDVTKDDIKSYKKFMTEQLRELKKARKLEVREKPSRHSVNSLETPKNSEINQEKLRQVKQRLQNRKLRRMKLRNELEDLADDSVALNRNKRAHNFGTNEVYVPKGPGSNLIAKQLYKPKASRGRSWKPQDIRRVKKIPSYSIEVVDNLEFLQRTAPVKKSSITGRKKRSTSTSTVVNDYVDSSENMIDDYSVKDLQKFRKYLTNEIAAFFTSESNVLSLTEAPLNLETDVTTNSLLENLETTTPNKIFTKSTTDSQNIKGPTTQANFIDFIHTAMSTIIETVFDKITNWQN